MFKLILAVASSAVYLLVDLGFDATNLVSNGCRRLGATTPINDKLFRDVVVEALRQLHGYVGGAVEVDILALEESSAIIRVDKRSV